MGGATIIVRGNSKKEVEKKLVEKLAEAEVLGLYEELRTPAEYDQNSQQFRALLKIHS